MPTLLIIGAGPGISASVARRYAREGWTIVLAARVPDRISAVSDALTRAGAEAERRMVDASDAAALRSLIQSVASAHPDLATIHFNAAAMHHASLFDLGDDAIAADVAVNVTGLLTIVAASVAALSAKGGTLLLTGGGLAMHPNPQLLTLGLGKAAVRYVAQTLFNEARDRGVHLATVTVAAMISPDSAEAEGVADAFWALQSQSADAWTWEIEFPQP